MLPGCASVPRPDVDLCIINAPAERRKCYNMKEDYDNEGKLKSGATPTYRSNDSVSDLNKGLFIDSADGPEAAIARLKAYLQKLRDEMKSCQ